VSRLQGGGKQLTAVHLCERACERSNDRFLGSGGQVEEVLGKDHALDTFVRGLQVWEECRADSAEKRSIACEPACRQGGPKD
jgi:hypothetical protein